MKSRTLATLAIVVGMIVAPLAAGTAAHAAGDDGGTEVVAPPAEETLLPADEEAAQADVVEPDSGEAEPGAVEPDVVGPDAVEPDGVGPDVVAPDVVVPDPEEVDPSAEPPIEVWPSGWVFEDCGTEYDALLLLVTPGIVYSPEGPSVEFEGALYSEYLPDEFGTVTVTASPEEGYVIALGDPTEWVMNEDGSVTATVPFDDEPCTVPTPTPTPAPTASATPAAVVLAATGSGDSSLLLPFGALGLIALGTLAAVFARKPVAAR
jgi:hypothetical protein